MWWFNSVFGFISLFLQSILTASLSLISACYLAEVYSLWTGDQPPGDEWGSGKCASRSESRFCMLKGLGRFHTNTAFLGCILHARVGPTLPLARPLGAQARVQERHSLNIKKRKETVQDAGNAAPGRGRRDRTKTVLPRSNLPLTNTCLGFFNFMNLLLAIKHYLHC